MFYAEHQIEKLDEKLLAGTLLPWRTDGAGVLWFVDAKFAAELQQAREQAAAEPAAEPAMIVAGDVGWNFDNGKMPRPQVDECVTVDALMAEHNHSQLAILTALFEAKLEPAKRINGVPYFDRKAALSALREAGIFATIKAVPVGYFDKPLMKGQ